MYGQIGRRDEPLHGEIRQEHKVSEADSFAGQEPKKYCVEPIKVLEYQTLCTANAFSNHDLHTRIFKRANQLGNRIGTILTIGIHNEDRAVGELSVNKRQSRCDRPLVPDIAVQSDHFAGKACVSEVVGVGR